MNFCKASLAFLCAGLLIPPSTPQPKPQPPLQTQESGPVVSPESMAISLEKALSQGQSEKAREILAQLLQSSPVSSDILLQVGIGLAQRELYSEAAEVFTRCARDYPAIFEAHYNLALANLALQKHSEALAALQHAPKGSKLQELARLYLRGKILEAQGQASEAERDLSAAFAGAPQQENYALDLGLFYLRQRAYPRATEIFDSGAHSHPQSTFLLLGLSLAQYLAGRTSQSVETCRKLLTLEAGFPPAQLLMAFALYQNGEFEESERVAAAGLSTAQPHPYLYYLHAAVLIKLQSKEYDRILQELALANRAIPACTLCYLAQSKVLETQKDFPAAIASLEKAVQLDPEFSEAWYHLSLVYRRAGRREDADRASAQFSKLKTEKANRETELLRDLFLQTLSGQ